MDQPRLCRHLVQGLDCSCLPISGSHALIRTEVHPQHGQADGDRSVAVQRILVTPGSVAEARGDGLAAQRLEGALTSSETALSLEALHAWVSSASDAVVVLRPNGDILYANDQASAAFARLPAALIGQPLAEVVTPASRVSVERALEMARQNGDATLQFETVLADTVFAEDRAPLALGQRLRHLEATLSPLPSGHFLVVARECRSCRALALAADPLIVVDPSGRISFANETVCNFMGISRDTVVGVNLASLLSPDGEGALDILLRHPSDTLTWTRSARVLCSGEPVPVQISLTDLGGGDSLLRFLPGQQASLQDHTEPMEFNGLQIDTAQRRVLQAGEVIHLSRTEFGILAALAREPGRVITPAELLKEVWGEEYVAEHSLLRTAIWRLRQRLEPDAQTPRFIVTVPGFGYRLGAES